MKEDLEEAIKNNPDVSFANKELLDKFNKVEFGTLLEVTKKISNKMIISDFKIVTEELISDALSKDDKKWSAKVYHGMRSILPDTYTEKEKDDKVLELARGVNKIKKEEEQKEIDLRIKKQDEENKKMTIQMNEAMQRIRDATQACKSSPNPHVDREYDFFSKRENRNVEERLDAIERRLYFMPGEMLQELRNLNKVINEREDKKMKGVKKENDG